MGSTNYNVLFFVCFLLQTSLFTQTNLVPNGGFEEYTECPYFLGELSDAFPWYNPTMNTPDYFHSCSEYVSVPSNNFFNTQYPKTGNGMAGFCAYYKGIEGKEYVSVELDEYLLPQTEYTISFYLVLSPHSSYALRNISVLFTPEEINEPGGNEIPLAPQLANQQQLYFTDTSQWTRFQNVYTANGTEKFLTIGHFIPSHLETDTLFLYNTDIPIQNAFIYYGIDDISLVEGNLLDLNEKETNGKCQVSVVNDALQLDFDTGYRGMLTISDRQNPGN